MRGYESSSSDESPPKKKAKRPEREISPKASTSKASKKVMKESKKPETSFESEDESEDEDPEDEDQKTSSDEEEDSDHGPDTDDESPAAPAKRENKSLPKKTTSGQEEKSRKAKREKKQERKEGCRWWRWGRRRSLDPDQLYYYRAARILRMEHEVCPMAASAGTWNRLAFWSRCLPSKAWGARIRLRCPSLHDIFQLVDFIWGIFSFFDH